MSDTTKHQVLGIDHVQLAMPAGGEEQARSFFVALLGFGVIKATAHTKLANAASNLGGLALYAATGAVIWPVGLAMAVFAVLGAQIGSRLALRIGARLIRPMLVLISCAMAIKLLSDPANPLRAAAGALLPR